MVHGSRPQPPRDADGYIDLQAVPDDDPGVDLAALAPVTPLDDETWDAIVAATPDVDVAAADIDVDRLVGGAPEEPPGVDEHGSNDDDLEPNLEWRQDMNASEPETHPFPWDDVTGPVVDGDEPSP